MLGAKSMLATGTFNFWPATRLARSSRVSAEHRFARSVIRNEEIVDRPQLVGRRMRQHQLGPADWMPQIGMLRQSDIVVARADRQQLEPGASYHFFEIGIRDNLHAMAAARQRRSQADHRMDVAVAAERRDDEMGHRRKRGEIAG